MTRRSVHIAGSVNVTGCDQAATGSNMPATIYSKYLQIMLAP